MERNPHDVIQISEYSDVLVEVIPYDPLYLDVAKSLARLIESSAADCIVEHVGSTAVPGCAGKGVIDLMLLYPEGMLARARAALDALGFQQQKGRDPFPESRPMRIGTVAFRDRSFRVHVHVIASGCAEHADMLAFRDLLRRDSDARAEYEAAKRQILGSGISEGVDYAHAKSAVVQRLSKTRIG